MTADVLVERLLLEAEDIVALQRASGALPSGYNGGYGDLETPVRCTAHALVSLCHAFGQTKRLAFRNAAEAALDYLLSVLELCPGCMIMRHAPGKDQSNGVLGQAFVIEAFHAAWRSMGSARARDSALTLLRRHPFDPTFLCWRRVDAGGESLDPDMTFNHQLYFAATAAMFREDPGVARDVDRFLAGWERTLNVRGDGRVVHLITTPGRKARFKAALRRRSNVDANQLKKEADYHLYNCYGFALLSRAGVDVAAAAGSKWQRIVGFLQAGPLKRSLEPASWSAPLRPGTETRVLDYEYFQSAFGDIAAPAYSRAFRYLHHVLGPDRQGALFSPDPVTMKARSYRYWRLAEMAKS